MEIIIIIIIIIITIIVVTCSSVELEEGKLIGGIVMIWKTISSSGYNIMCWRIGLV